MSFVAIDYYSENENKLILMYMYTKSTYSKNVSIFFDFFDIWHK